MPAEDAAGAPGELPKHASETPQVSKSALCRGGDPRSDCPPLAAALLSPALRAPLRAPLRRRSPPAVPLTVAARDRKAAASAIVKKGSVSPRAGERARSSASTTI